MSNGKEAAYRPSEDMEMEEVNDFTDGGDGMYGSYGYSRVFNLLLKSHN